MFCVVESALMDERSNTIPNLTGSWFTEGDKFYSIEDLTTKIEQFEKDNHVQLWKRDAKLFKSQSKK